MTSRCGRRPRPCVGGSDGTNDSSRVTVRPQASFLEMIIHSVPICLSSSQELAELQRFGYDLDFKRSLSWLVNWEMALDVLRPQSFGRTGIVACLACQCKCSFGSLSCSNTTVKDVCVFTCAARWVTQSFSEPKTSHHWDVFFQNSNGGCLSPDVQD